ncbi:hypothetical protein F5148DRAFT_1208881 [Russula earlei]|uniref:Uncharacterized protein n=1 Tax=Russula earlei TaxID=71964 RepID=A0ACC0U5V3_9AGAM|nr:hypothetical protein F5148DRAFT_1208881 [Russula earlei]
MPRPVLVDLPLDRFLQHVSDSANLPTPCTGSKRSRSPSLAHSIFSPAKRRILEQEGLFLPPQALPYPSASIHSLHPHRSAHLHALDSPRPLSGSSSPAAGLGGALTLLSCHLVPPLPCESRRISPRLSASLQSKYLLTSPHDDDATPIARTRTSPRRTRPQATTPTHTRTHAPPSSQRPRHAPTTTPTPMSTTPTPPTPPRMTKAAATKRRSVTMVPREMPPPPDRRSVHYPGFDVHRDTHIFLPHTRSKAREKAEAEAKAAARVAEADNAAKENVRPVPMSAGSAPSTGGKAKLREDAAPRRSARLRTNSGACAPSQKAVMSVPTDARVHGRRRSALHDPSLPF